MNPSIILLDRFVIGFGQIFEINLMNLACPSDDCAVSHMVGAIISWKVRFINDSKNLTKTNKKSFRCQLSAVWQRDWSATRWCYGQGF